MFVNNKVVFNEIIDQLNSMINHHQGQIGNLGEFRAIGDTVNGRYLEVVKMEFTFFFIKLSSI